VDVEIHAFLTLAVDRGECSGLTSGILG